MTCDNCGDPATKFLPNNEAIRLMTDTEGDFLCDDCYDWVVSMDDPNPDAET